MSYPTGGVSGLALQIMKLNWNKKTTTREIWEIRL